MKYSNTWSLSQLYSQPFFIGFFSNLLIRSTRIRYLCQSIGTCRNFKKVQGQNPLWMRQPLDFPIFSGRGKREWKRRNRLALWIWWRLLRPFLPVCSCVLYERKSQNWPCVCNNFIHFQFVIYKWQKQKLCLPLEKQTLQQHPLYYPFQLFQPSLLLASDFQSSRPWLLWSWKVYYGFSNWCPFHPGRISPYLGHHEGRSKIDSNRDKFI